MAIEIKSAHRPRRLPRLRSSREVRATVERAEHRLLILRGALITSVVACVLSVAALLYCYQKAARLVDARLASGYLTSRAGIYAAPRVLRAGQHIPRARLIETLRRAGYVENAAGDVWNGAFAVKADAVEILPRRGANTPDVVAVAYDRRGRIREITGDGVTLAAFALEPEALTNDAAMKTGQRAELTFDQLPPVVTQAILAIEDRRFFTHGGVDAAGLGRALLSWTGFNRADELERQGGSTITQQLVKNTYLTPERTLRRKFNEALLATALERRLSKRDIFALYCNEIYLGQRGAVAVRGVAQAAHLYFGKELKDLTLVEAATIAGMIQSPARYAPDRHPAEARARRNLVLGAMLRDGAITRDEAAAAASEPVSVAPLAEDATTFAPYFIDYVNRLVDARLPATGPSDERNLRVYTTLDSDLQQLAEAAVKRQLERLEKVYKGKATPQAALVALDPQTGHVLAMVGGDSYARTQLHRATDARRQPGSVFKPLVYAAALEGGVSPATMMMDAPQTFAYDRRSVYRPANYGGGYSMQPVMMRTGLVRSLNVVTVALALRAGLPRVAALAEKFGLQRPAPYPALALGTSEATPLEIASAYTAFANGGTRAAPAALVRAVDGEGASLFTEIAPVAQAVVRPSTAYMITDALTSVIDEGTARAARGVQRQTAAAGKTGTSHDGWFAGYTPNLVCVVWVGFDDNKQLGLTGAVSALPVWQEFIEQAVALRPELGGEAFVRPDGITTVEIDAETGLLAAPYCPHRQRIAVTPALAPNVSCFTHEPPLQMLAYGDASSYVGAQTIASEAVDTNALSTPARPTRVPRLTEATEAERELMMLAPHTTQTEISRTGRARLTNELRIVNTPRKAPR